MSTRTRPERRISVPDPARFTAYALARALKQHDLLADTWEVETRTPIARAPEQSNSTAIRRPIREVMHQTNKASDNLGAELLLRALDGAEVPANTLGPRSIDAGIAVLHADFQELGLDTTNFRLADGSGVSHYTLLTAQSLIATLVDMHRRGGEGYEIFADSLPVAGVDGTLRNRMRDTTAQGCVRAKTGTISGVSNLAGYVTTRSGRQLAFAILVQNFVGSSAEWRRVQDAFCVQLAEL